MSVHRVRELNSEAGVCKKRNRAWIQEPHFDQFRQSGSEFGAEYAVVVRALDSTVDLVLRRINPSAELYLWHIRRLIPSCLSPAIFI